MKKPPLLAAGQIVDSNPILFTEIKWWTVNALFGDDCCDQFVVSYIKSRIEALHTFWCHRFLIVLFDDLFCFPFFNRYVSARWTIFIDGRRRTENVEWDTVMLR